MKLNIKRSILLLSILSVLFLSMAMVSASDISADDSVSVDAADSDIVSTDSSLSTDYSLSADSGSADAIDIASSNEDKDNYRSSNLKDDDKNISKINYEFNDTVFYGDDVTIKANLTDMEGNIIDEFFQVAVYDNGTPLQSNSLKGKGTVIVPTDSLTKSSYYDLVLSFSGNEEYTSCNEFTGFNVIFKNNSYLAISNYDSYSKINSTKIKFVIYDEDYEYINDTADVYLNGEYYTSVLTSGNENEVTIENLLLGDNTVLVKYNGSQTYKESEDSVTIVGYEKNTSIGIDTQDILIGNDAVININLTDEDGNIVGGQMEVEIREVYGGEDESYVPFKDDYIVTGQGTIIIHQSKLHAGSTYLIRADYEGNLTYFRSTNADSFECFNRSTFIFIEGGYASDDKDITLGIGLFDRREWLISGIVNLTVLDNESNVVIETISVETSADDFVYVTIGKLPYGHYIINASFGGNEEYEGCEFEAYLHVFKATNLTIEAIDQFKGESQIVNFSLVSADGGLNASASLIIRNMDNDLIYAGEINFTDGKASYNLDNLEEDLIIFSHYENELAFAGPFETVYESASKFATVRIIKQVNGTIEFDPVNDSIIVNLLDIDGNPIADAPLSVNVSGRVFELASDENGQLKLNNIPNNVTIEVSYTDNQGLVASNKIVILVKEEIKQRAASKIVCKNMSTVAVATPDGRVGEYFNVTLTDADGNPLVNKTVMIGFNGRVYTRTTNETGEVNLQINLGYKGSYTFAMCFLGDDDYNASYEVCVIKVSSHQPKLTGSDKTYKVSAKTKAISATFKTSNGNAISGKSLVFIIDGKLYNAKTNSKGVATVNVSISKKGTYSCTVRSSDDGMYAATSTKFNVKIV